MQYKFIYEYLAVYVFYTRYFRNFYTLKVLFFSMDKMNQITIYFIFCVSLVTFIFRF